MFFKAISNIYLGNTNYNSKAYSNILWWY